MAGAKHISEGTVRLLANSGFWNLVNFRAKHECWPWKGAKHESGYGRFTVGRDEYRAHRVAFALGKNTALPGVVMVCHRCDNPGCVNPDHLFIGLASDNNEDARSKGHHVAPRALKNGRGKLSDLQVDEVRASPETGAAIAARLGVSRALVSMIRRGSRRVMVGDAGIEPATFRV